MAEKERDNASADAREAQDCDIHGGGRVFVPDRKLWKPVRPGDHVWLVDGSGFIFRAYHALPPLTRKSDGLPVGAVHGFVAMLHKLLVHMNEGRRPTHLAVVFDAGRETFRNDIYADYKANRPEPPADLVPQFDLIRQATEAFGIALVEQQGYEADDLLATYARQAREAGAVVHIVSSDKDLMQLVRDGVFMFDPMKERDIGVQEVVKRFGVPPEKVVDVQALAGDSTDNVPGVPGIGVKTAALLLEQYGDLENLLAHVDEIPQPKRRERLKEHAEQARLSRRLVKLDDHVPVKVPLDAFAVHPPDPRRLVGFLKGLEFTTLTSRIARDLGVDPSAIPAREVRAACWRPPGEEEEELQAEAGRGSRCEAARRAEQALAGLPFSHAGYELVTRPEDLRRWLDEARAQGFLAFDVETTSLDAMRAGLVGVALALAPDRAAYVPLAHRPAASDELDLREEDSAFVEQMDTAEALEMLRPLLEDEAVLKIAHNIKYDAEVLRRHGVRVRAFDDTMLLSYVLRAGLGGHGLDELSRLLLAHQPIAFRELVGARRAARAFDEVEPRRACEYAAEDADVALRLWLLLRPALHDVGKSTVYETLERPLVDVLIGMEMTGVLVDRARLRRLADEFARKAGEIEKRIFALAGHEFNVGSTRQLARVLFEEMGHVPPRKTARGAPSTDNAVLEELAGKGVELARLVLDWRQLMKLRSTYAEALVQHINPRTGRVHTSYSLAATSTGRLASTDPNLQNIPVRTEEGRRIRACFVAPPGHRLVSCDYSQIELRILAEVGDVKRLKDAFRQGLDIHAATAAEVFGVPLEEVDADLRRKAKTINFGIVYGISPHGLSARLGISRAEASDYIKAYFRRFPEIRDYIERTKEFAHAHGYVETLFGRRIHFPDIDASNPSVRAFNERAAINAPLQGTAADVIRRAMIRMPAALAEAGLGARMLMQVHDELVFEVLEEEVERTIEVARRVMSEAPLPAVRFEVPLVVDAGVGANWEEAH